MGPPIFSIFFAVLNYKIMNKNKKLLNLSGYLLSTIILVLFSYCFIDRQVAELAVNNNLNKYPIFKYFTYFAEIFYVVAPTIILVIGIRKVIFDKKISYFFYSLFYSSMAVLVASAIKNQLKFVFSRAWPNTWIENNPSWIHDHVYGFFWFKSHGNYTSFPSGHSAVVFAFMSVIFLRHKNLRSLAILVCGLELLGLSLMAYHYVGDMIAGASIGILTGYIAVNFAKNSSD